MPRRSIHSIVARRSSSTDRSMPWRADRAWRRNWITDTPGTSCGYWKARNMPALARSSAGQSVISSSPRNTRPAVTWYSGEPISDEASVLLPDPLGPMMACTSPGSTMRSRPRRIGSIRRAGWSGVSAGSAHRPSTRNNAVIGIILRACC